jgi:RHS repeat-associated protein
MTMPACTYSSQSGYRYGFNGKEKLDEVYGGGNLYDYGERIYDPRLGRLLSIDPLTDEYAELSTYQYANNSPIANIDLLGEQNYWYGVTFDKDGKSQVVLVKSETFYLQLTGGQEGWTASNFIYYNANNYYRGDGPVAKAGIYSDLTGKTKDELDAFMGIQKSVPEMNAEAKAQREQELKELFTGAIIVAYAIKFKSPTTSTSTTNQQKSANNKTNTTGKKEENSKKGTKGDKTNPVKAGATTSNNTAGANAKGNLGTPLVSPIIVKGKLFGNYGEGTITDSKNNIIGSVQNNFGNLDLYVNTKGTEYNGRGNEVFKALVNSASNTFYIGINGTWTSGSLGSNLRAFNNAINNGLTPQQAAFKTFTGTNAKELGFKNVTINSTLGTKGNYTAVSVTFTN